MEPVSILVVPSHNDDESGQSSSSATNLDKAVTIEAKPKQDSEDLESAPVEQPQEVSCTKTRCICATLLAFLIIAGIVIGIVIGRSLPSHKKSSHK
jgi:F0F1-type ATP synthase assembly protein I